MTDQDAMEREASARMTAECAPPTPSAAERPPAASGGDEITARWHEIQATFVDDPRAAVEQARALVAEAVDRACRGLQGRRDDLNSQWSAGTPSTEDLRTTLQGYRALLDRAHTIEI